MTSIERLKRSLEGKSIDRVPFLLQGEVVGYTAPFLSLFKEKTGSDSPADYFGFDVRGIFLNPTKRKHDFSEYFGNHKEMIKVDEWGVGIRPGSISHLIKMVHPLKNSVSIKDFENYPFPDLREPYRYEGLKERIDSFHQRGLPVACFSGSIFEQAWYLRGLEELLMDFAANHDFAHELLERITHILIDVSKKVAGLGIDVLIIGDDIAGQQGLTISLDHYRTFLKFRHTRIVQAVKSVNPDIKVLYHSDGNVLDVIPDLIDTGIDILNPIQPECVDPALVKSKYGNYLSFWGAFSLQQTLPFGTKDEIFREIKTRVSTIGKGGRYVLAPAHVIGSDVPWSNITAFCEAVHEAGVIRRE